MKINLNSRVRVTLTEQGAKAYNHYHAQFRYPVSCQFKSKKAGDVIQMQLWDIMSVFGSAICIGSPIPFEDNTFEIVELK